jgi:hypothetical protein
MNGTTDNYMTISADNGELMIGGFNVAKPFGSALNASQATAAPRAIGTVNAAGTYSLALVDSNTIYGTSYPKTAASPDGISQFWTIGGAGVIYSVSGADTFITNSPGGRYVSEIFSNNLYACLSGGLYQFNGLPTTSGIAPTKLFTSSNPNDFAISPDGLTIYVTDGSNIAQSGGGIQRWDNSGGVWNMTYTYSTPPYNGTTGNNGPLGLAVDFSNFAGGGASGFGAVLYGTTGQGMTNSLFQIIDTDGGETPTILYTFGPNQGGRGLRFGPSVVVALPKLTATASGNTITITWPDTATGFTLESTPTLPATWTPTGLPVNDINGQNTVTDQINGQKYYRLHK